MKKFVFFTVFLILSFFAFAKSDLSFRLCPVYNQETYQLDGELYGVSNSQGEIGVINYNFFNENSPFGFFDMLGINFSDSGAFNFSLGAAFSSLVNDIIRFQCGLGGNFFYYTYSDYNEKDENDIWIEEDITKIFFGITTDLAMKFTPKRLFSPVIGVTFYYDPIVINQKMKSGKLSSENYDFYNRFSFSPYINFCINLN